jgi:hypothetical protein
MTARVGISSAILHLFGMRCPSAILRGVWSVVVDSVDGVLRRWAATHVGEKIAERMSPSSTNSDATSAVISEITSLGIFAAFDHVTPASMFWSLASTVRASIHFHRLKVQTTA